MPVWVRELAEQFWRAMGTDPFPRTFAQLALACPLTVIERPNLSISAIQEWLAKRQVHLAISGLDRRIRGCLVAHGWDGFVFVDARDPADERRFTLAHELAHYLRDVWRPRRRAIDKLGPRFVEVLDGRRLATPAERLRALVRGLPTGPVVHVLGRGDSESLEVRNSEAAADRLAFELLAPADTVQNPMELIDRFGLPPSKAAEYTRLLWPTLPANRLLDVLSCG
jgi:IrrE N-terminal-like domain